MANVRQMPGLYLRGSLANITMKNLTEQERTHVESLVTKVTTHPEMQRHKIKVMKELGVTIAGDYSNDRDIAEEEYLIAVWRGVVDLFYHRPYTFKCKACNSSTYLTKRQRPKPFDRIYKSCPNCKMVELTNPGEIQSLQEKFTADIAVYIDEDEFQESYANLPDGFAMPVAKSPIVSIPGPAKYLNPQAIIDDDKQLRKFFGEFVWNYFRQQINENKRKEHRKEPQTIHGPADMVILQELLCLCRHMEVDYNYCQKTEPRNGVHTVGLFGLLTPPEFTAEFAALRAKAWLHKINVEVTNVGFTVAVCPDAPIIEAEIVKPEHVSMLDSFVTSSDQQESDNISQISYRTVEGYRMDLDNHVDVVDQSEAMGATRDTLPDGDCRDVFDIFANQGEKYIEFSQQYGDGAPKINHVAKFLGITTRTVNNYKNSIKVALLANGLTPV